jgi:sporulation protein YlmC with PRC-barrel domain
MNPPAIPAPGPQHLLRATKLLDCEMRDGADGKIGAVEDLVIDRPDARVACAIVSLGLLGFGERRFAIPFPALRFGEDDTVISLDVPRAQLAKARVADDALRTEELAAHGMVRASATLGEEVLEPNGTTVGAIDDLVFETATGRVFYVVLSMGGFLGLGDRLHAIPFAALRRSPTAREPYVLDASKEHLEKSHGFDRDHWPDLDDRRWSAAIHADYGLSS